LVFTNQNTIFSIQKRVKISIYCWETILIVFINFAKILVNFYSKKIVFLINFFFFCKKKDK
jgi:hypothetical protein